MEPAATSLEDRLARLEGQYHALSKELSDGFKDLHDTLNDVHKQVESLQNVKSGMLSSESLADVISRIDQRIDDMHKQVIAISNALQIRSR
jgi:hypothetical protein